LSLLFSIITPCYNSAELIEQTVQSVLGQSYPHIEYLVMDAASTDGTLDILRRYEAQLQLTSEPDEGQTAAINTGWRRASGDVLAWLNADDRFLPDSVQQAADYFAANPQAGWVYGKPIPVDTAGDPFPYHDEPEPWDYDRLLAVNFITQPTVFIRRNVFETVGPLDESLHYIFDYEYWLRIGRQFPGHFVPGIKAVVTYNRQTKSATGGILKLNELEAVIRKYGGSDLPLSGQYEWVGASLLAFATSIRKGRWRKAWSHLKGVFRYPRRVPRGILKLCVTFFIPLTWETRLRQMLLRREAD
jgi:glycosyltransferase involved in cell wall biosynthesis